jgi:hypothetical protein
MKVNGFIPGTLPDCLPAAASLSGLRYANNSVRGAGGSTKKVFKEEDVQTRWCDFSIGSHRDRRASRRCGLPFGGVVVTRAASPDRARR